MSCRRRCLSLSQGNSRAEILCQFVHDALCQLVEFIGVRTFEKQTRLLFSSGISQHDTTFPLQPRFGLSHSLCQPAKLLEWQFFTNRDVPEDLWKSVQDLTKVAKSFSSTRHDGHNLQRGDKAVPGGRKVPEDEMAALLTTEVQLVLNHGVYDESVADIRAQHLATVPTQDFIEAEVAHHCRDERVCAQLISCQ